MIATVNNFASLVKFSGKGAQARAATVASIPCLARDDVAARDALIDAVKATLDHKADADTLATVRTLIIVGRIAARLPIADGHNDAAHLSHMFDLVTRYAAPPKEGAAARKLRAGQLGRRSAIEHKAIRAAEEALSQIMADAGHGKAKPQAERKKQTRAAHHNTKAKPATQASVADVAPSHDTLLVAPVAMTTDDAINHVMKQASALAAYGNKYAALLPTDYGTALIQFKVAINKAANDYALRQAIVDGEKAEKED